MTQNYSNTRIRYEFFNGKDTYTVQYDPGLRTWYVFKGTEDSGCVYSVKYGKPPKFSSINADAALDILYEYFENKQP